MDHQESVFGGGGEATSTAGGLFLRRSSGLVREFSARDAFIFNVVAFAPGLSIALIPLSLSLTVPNVNVFALIAVATAFAVCNGLTYAYLSAVMPRSGGEYVYLGRTISPALGFTANWGFTWSQILGIAFYAGFTVTFAIATPFFILSAVLPSGTLSSWSNSVSKQWPTFLIATAFVVVVAVVLMLGPRVIRRFMLIAFVPALIGSLITIVVFATTSHSDFVHHFNAFSAAHGTGVTYNQVFSQAAKEGFVNHSNTFGALIDAMPIAAFFFIGFTYSAYIGGEVKEPGKTQPRMIILSLAFCCLFYVINLGLFYHIVGQGFYNSFVALSYSSKGAGFPASAAPVINLFGGMMTSNSILNILMALSFFIWPFILLFAMATVCSRNLFAWSFDRIMPAAFTKVDSRFSSPWVATLVIVAGIEVLLALYVFTTFFQNITNYTAIFSVAFWLASWAAILLPYRRRDLFEAAPPSARRQVLGVPVMALVGVGNLVLYTLSLIGVFKFPAFSGPNGTRAILFVVAIYLSGIVIYALSSQIQLRRGVDLALIYKELPPE
jgi:basic amino acid/polyamine antiporter, APA family